MILKTKFEMDNEIAKITLAGQIDPVTVPLFQAEVEKAIAQKAKRIVFFMHDLEYITSSGLKVLLDYKQKVGPAVDIYVIAPRPLVAEVFEMTGFNQILNVRETYNAQEIENI